MTEQATPQSTLPATPPPASNGAPPQAPKPDAPASQPKPDAPASQPKPDAPASQPKPEDSAKKKSVMTRLRPWLVLAVVVIAGIIIWRYIAFPTKPPENVIELSGRLEGDDSAISPKTAGRIAQIHFREGDLVKAGEIIAILDDQQIRAREQQARAAVTQAQARLKASVQQVAIIEEQLRQAELETGQSKLDAQGKVSQAEADQASVEAQFAQQVASMKLADFDRIAYTQLESTGAASRRQKEQAVSAAEAQEAAVAAAKRKVESSRAALEIARATLVNPAIRNSASAALRRQIAQQQSEIASSQADAQRSQALLDEAVANRADLIVRAPFDGTVATRTAEPGEVVQAGTAIVTLIDLRKVYLRGYIPEGRIGQVKLGQPAHIYLDSSPKQPIDASVLRIDPQATFTPENTYFRDDRVKQVIGVKLQLKGGFGFAKPGMPADGEVLVQGDQWPERKRR